MMYNMLFDTTRFMCSADDLPAGVYEARWNGRLWPKLELCVVAVARPRNRFLLSLARAR